MHTTNTSKMIGAMCFGGHFVYAGHEHGDSYVNLRLLLKKSERNSLQQIAYELLVSAIKNAHIDLTKPVVVLGPETLGSVMAVEAVWAFNKQHPATKPLRSHTFRKQILEDGSKQYVWGGVRKAPCISRTTQIIWMDDVLTNGSTFKSTRKFFAQSATVIVAVAVDRSKFCADDLKIDHLECLAKLDFDRFAQKACPLCRADVPIVTNLGHGEDFRRRNPDYAGGFIEI